MVCEGAGLYTKVNGKPGWKKHDLIPFLENTTSGAMEDGLEELEVGKPIKRLWSSKQERGPELKQWWVEYRKVGVTQGKCK